MFQFLHKRSIHGLSLGKGKSLPLDLSFMLTKFKNFNNDEYSTSDDDGLSVPPMACAFAKTYVNGNILSVVDEDGYIVLYDVNKTGPAAVKDTWQAHANAVFDMHWAEDDKQILTASGDQTVALWEVEGNKKLEVFKGHTSSVKSVSIRIGDEAVFASGSRDGHVMIWDKRIFHKEGTIPPVDTIYNAHAHQQTNTPGKARKKKLSALQPKDGQQSVTCVLFQDNNYLISCGAVDGCIKVWDLRKTYKIFTAGATPVQVFHYPGSSLRKHGFSCLTLDDSRSRLFASCTDDTIYEYNMKSDEDKPVCCFRGHKNSTFYVKTAISPDNQFLLGGSSDNHAYIWQINKPGTPPVVLKAHDAEVTSVAWCPTDLTKVVTLSDDAKTKFWRIYCREQKSSALPQWLGRARRFSKERSTSMAETPPMKRQMKQSMNTPSPSQSPLHHSKSQQTPVTTTPKSLRDWLKRKSKDTECSQGPSASKVLWKNSECASPLPEEQSTSCKRPFCNISGKKDDSLHCDRCHLKSSPHPTQCDKNSNCIVPAKKYKIDSDNSSSPVSALDKSLPGTPKRKKDTENLNHTSPRKLFKRCLNLKDSPTKSPKRPCLSTILNNGQIYETGDRISSVKVSLFESIHSGDSKSPLKTSVDSSAKCTENVDDPNACKLQQISSSGKGGEYSDGSSQHGNDSSTPSKQKLPHRVADEGDLDSPTRNLPNLVMDQMTNLRPTSPLLSKSSQSKKVDWLTRLKLNKDKRDNESSDKSSLQSLSGGIVKSPKTPKSVKMKTIQAYFKAQYEYEK